jgi:hypothetical protein
MVESVDKKLEAELEADSVYQLWECRNGEYHIVPAKDYVPHVMEGLKCWCRPKFSEKKNQFGDSAIVHNDMGFLLAEKLKAEIEAEMRKTIMGPPGESQRPVRRTAWRVCDHWLEVVELDDDGKVIEPVRCTCGHGAFFHRSGCPFSSIT